LASSSLRLPYQPTSPMQPKPMGKTAAGPWPTGRAADAGVERLFMGRPPYPMRAESGSPPPMRAWGIIRGSFCSSQAGRAMIIDCHGHYPTAPQPLTDFRDAQKAALKDPAQTPSRASLEISDDQIRDSLENAQLKLQRERGSDLTVFSPRASTMAHHIGNESTSIEWSQISNDLIARVVDLYPANFVGVCMLPQSPGAPLAGSVKELERCAQMGF